MNKKILKPALLGMSLLALSLSSCKVSSTTNTSTIKTTTSAKTTTATETTSNSTTTVETTTIETTTAQECMISLTKNIDEAGSIRGEGNYLYNSVIILSCEVNDGYLFDGWYDGEKMISDSKTLEYTVLQTKTVEARFSYDKYKVTIENYTELVISGAISDNDYSYKDKLTITTNNESSNYVLWYIDDVLEAYGNSYTFTMPNKNINIRIELTNSIGDITYDRDENKIYFGEYPQELVTDDELKSELNNIAGELPNSSNLNNWNDYNYYINREISSYMYYIDIDYDKDGIYDYRGVYFTEYRPIYAITSKTDNTFQEQNNYLTNEVYWFSYDSIEWDILFEDNGKALIISNLILDSQEFYPTDTTQTFEHNGSIGYTNNYELSNIRKFLNDTFYNQVFNNIQKGFIEETLLDNSLESTTEEENPYICNDTLDNIFLLSCSEAIDYYSTNESRKAKATDYANSQGLRDDNAYDCNYWWLRSPKSSYGSMVWMVYTDGQFSANMAYMTHYGVRPACWINLI
ncbi:MAG: DUF6273 domain-containing protein [Bacilli bacterium]|nr:DUF6273 domain-containing protein [Bacilli bacterium]